MRVRRALVDCAVLSVQDTCLFYPCCKHCFSRIDVEERDTKRCKCSKCGFCCMKEQIDYRYRLSLRVNQDKCIFRLTVFGSCLDRFFGINAGGLQRLVDSDGSFEAPVKSALLVKAVEECFVGRHFIFGIKITDTENDPLLDRPALTGFNSKETAQLIANQISLPKATALGGCSVLNYYTTLLQKAADYPLVSTSPASRLPQTTLLLVPHQSPAVSSSFNNTTSPASCHLSQFLLRSQLHDHTVSPTPPWEQSLGLVTSSAEQEEDFSSQDCGDELNSRQIHEQNVQHHTPGCLRDYRENYKYSEERILSPLLSLNDNSSRNGAARGEEKRKAKEVYGCGERGHAGGLCDRGRSRRQKEMETDDPLWRPLTGAAESSSSSSSSSNSHRRTLLDISNTAGLVHGGDPQLDSADQLYRDTNGCENCSQGNNVCSPQCKQEDEEGISALLRQCEAEEEHLCLCDGEGIYDCSADLFSDSVNTQTLETHESDSSRQTFDSEALPAQFRHNQQHLNSLCEKATTDVIQHDCFQAFDFIPPSQSTPTANTAAPSGLTTSSPSMYALARFNWQPDGVHSCIFYNSVPERDSENPAKITSLHCNSNSSSVNLVNSTASGRHSHRLTPKRRLWKLDKPHSRLIAQKRLRLQTARNLNRGSTERRQNHTHDQSLYNTSVYDDEDVPLSSPKMPPFKPRLKGETKNCSGDFGYVWRGQQSDGVNCKRSLSDQILTLSKTGNEDYCQSDHSSKAESSADSSVGEVTLKRSINQPPVDEREACDWSKDLFSDSF